jgi:hypothetical protein
MSFSFLHCLGATLRFILLCGACACLWLLRNCLMNLAALAALATLLVELLAVPV